MSLVLDVNEPAITRGIKTVGVGKKGSKPLTAQLALEILEDLNAGKVSPAAKGAFFAGLTAKGIEGHEEVLSGAFAPGILKDSVRLVEALAPDAPEFARWVCVRLLAGQTLDKQTAYDLGKFLFSDDPGDGARGLAASFLRVRYETDDEYEGIWNAMQETIAPAFCMPTPPGGPIVQMAEPFDGVDHSHMITPLIGRYVQGLGYRVAHQVGRNSGPKLAMNLWDIAQALGESPARGNGDLASAKRRFGWFFHQSSMSAALDRWVSIRRQIIKRPFLSTLERFINPLKADILFASAFHPPYGEKMTTLAERAGFKGIIVVRNGMEGTMAFPLLRPVKLLLSVKRADGLYQRHEMVLEAPKEVETEEMVEKPQASHNARLIDLHIKTGASNNQHFDLRVKVTCEGFRQGLSWLKENMGG
ncbi:MAG: hypothetical protein HY591_07215 [Candidatus Omnitrophica bacterium]|nr:hypothetical protein [Candidatus Omnitrophota bacterium]